MSVENKSSTIQQRMGFNPNRRDPIPRTDRDLLSADSTKIKHNGGIDSNETFCIVHKYETEDEKQIRENREEYGYEVSDIELATQTQCFYSGYDDGWGQSFAYDEETYYDYGTRSDDYIAMVESGDIVHGEFSCDLPEGIGASFEGEEFAEDPEITPEQQASKDATPAEPKGELATAFDAAVNPEPEPAPAAVATINPTYQAPALRA